MIQIQEHDGATPPDRSALRSISRGSSALRLTLVAHLLTCAVDAYPSSTKANNIGQSTTIQTKNDAEALTSEALPSEASLSSPAQYLRLATRRLSGKPNAIPARVGSWLESTQVLTPQLKPVAHQERVRNPLRPPR